MSLYVVFYAAFAIGLVGGALRLAAARDELKVAVLSVEHRVPPHPLEPIAVPDPIDVARAAYMRDAIDVDEFERRAGEALAGGA